jgi:hypothetical protein
METKTVRAFMASCATSLALVSALATRGGSRERWGWW